MIKKYQFFISSTYSDLKEERKKVMEAILEAEQIPAGMELFSAADDEQWKIIEEAIGASDYYILILGRRYGSVFEKGEDSGISYTEKEFDYAVSKGIPILPFIIDDDMPVFSPKEENDPEKSERLLKFKNKVKGTHTVKFWKDSNELAAEVAQSLYKAIMRGNRPGWVRTTEFNIEESMAEILKLTQRVHKLEELNADLRLESNRRPNLQLEMYPIFLEDGSEHLENMEIADDTAIFHIEPVYMADAEKGIDYKDKFGQKIRVDRDEVHMFRYLYKNAFPVNFSVRNYGDARATGVRVKMTFPSELMTISPFELHDYIKKDTITASTEAYQNWEARFYAPDGCDAKENDENVIIPLSELMTIPDIANLLDPADHDGSMSIYPGEILYENDEVRHKDQNDIGDVYILPTAVGRFKIRCEILCNEIVDTVNQDLIIEVELG